MALAGARTRERSRASSQRPQLRWPVAVRDEDPLALLPQFLRSATPERIRDHSSLRASALALGLIPPRTMHSEDDARVLGAAAVGARQVVEIGVYEGASALVLLEILDAGVELHLIDPFGAHPDALPAGWGAREWSTRRVVSRAARRLGESAPRVRWHPALSHEVANAWSTGAVDLVFIDGDHSELGCRRDWDCWSPLVVRGGHVVFHDARAGISGGRGLPGPSAVVEGLFRGTDPIPGWRIDGEADRTVAVRRL